MITYKCLFLDHDDTIFDSTRTIHYPAFLKTLSTLRPSQTDLSYESFFEMCHELGFERICDEVYHFDADELKIEYAIWKQFTKASIPHPFDGIGLILIEYIKQGGKIVVVSHSESSEIKRDYRTHFGFEPDLVFGWELGSAFRKPNPYPMIQALQTLQLKPEDCLVIDDMRLGLEMAQLMNVAFACAAWSHSSKKIKSEMMKSSTFYLDNVKDLIPLIFK